LTGRFLQVAPESPQEAENAKRLATKTLLRYFQNNGYATYAAGKVFDGLLEGAWTASLKFDARRTKCQDSRSERRNEPRCAPVIDTVDAAPARWLRERIRWHDVKKKPFLAAFGLRRPHAPWEYAAEHYEDKSLPPSPTFPADAPLVSWSDNWGRVAKRSGNKGRCPTPKGGLPPPRLAQHFRGAYAASCQTADTYLGRVLDACDARTDNLVVAVTSDHGMHLGDHGIWSKQTLFDYSLRVPLILRGPGVPIRVVDTPVETARLFSTLSFLAGLEVPPGVEPVLPPFGPSTPARSFYTRPCAGFESSRFASCLADKAASGAGRCGPRRTGTRSTLLATTSGASSSIGMGMGTSTRQVPSGGTSPPLWRPRCSARGGTGCGARSTRRGARNVVVSLLLLVVITS